jgi:F-type H+-transporting ATPase subunit delta
MEELIAKRYAKALSMATKDVKSLVAKLDVLSEALSNKEVSEVLLSPIVDSDKKTDMVLSVLKKDKDGILKNFIKVLGEKKRLDLIPAITKVLNAEIQKESNVYEGVLKSSKELDEKEIKKLEKTLSNYTGAKIKLNQEKSELDGLRVSVDDLGIEVNFSKERVKEQLIDFIKKSL